MWRSEVPILIEVIGFHPQLIPHLLLAMAAVGEGIAFDGADGVNWPMAVVEDTINSRIANAVSRCELLRAWR